MIGLGLNVERSTSNVQCPMNEQEEGKGNNAIWRIDGSIYCGASFERWTLDVARIFRIQ